MSPPEDLIYIHAIECPMEYPVDKDVYMENQEWPET